MQKWGTTNVMSFPKKGRRQRENHVIPNPKGFVITLYQTKTRSNRTNLAAEFNKIIRVHSIEQIQIDGFISYLSG